MRDAFHLGLVYPGGGPETDFYHFERVAKGKVKVFLSNSEFGIVDGSDHHPGALRMTAEVPRIAAAGKRLASCDLDALVWACTSGSFVEGRAFAEDQAAQLSEQLGISVTSTSLAFAAAAMALGIETVALLSTYPEPATDLFVRFLNEYGLSVQTRLFLGNPSGWHSATMNYEDILGHVENLNFSGSQALMIPDTALPSLAWVSRLEREIGRPVLSANAVSLWHGMKVKNGEFPLPELDCDLFRLKRR